MRAAAVVEHHLHHLRKVRLRRLQGAGKRRHLGARAQERGNLRDRVRIDQGLVPLHVQIPVGREIPGSLRDPLGPVAAGRVRHQGAKPRGLDCLGDPRVVRRDGHGVDPCRLAGALGDAHDHRDPADVGERLSGQSLGGVARGNQGCEAHVVL